MLGDRSEASSSKSCIVTMILNPSLVTNLGSVAADEFVSFVIASVVIDGSGAVTGTVSSFESSSSTGSQD